MPLPSVVLICSKLMETSVRLFSGYSHPYLDSYLEEQPVLGLLSLFPSQLLSLLF